MESGLGRSRSWKSIVGTPMVKTIAKQWRMILTKCKCLFQAYEGAASNLQSNSDSEKCTTFIAQKGWLKFQQ